MTTLQDNLIASGSSFALLVDDHPLFRRGLKEFLESSTELRQCVEASNIAEAVDAFQKRRPDLVLIDITLGGENGLLLVERLRHMDSGVRILVVSMHREEFYARRTREAGGNGYICKGANYDEILEAVNSVLHGKTYFGGETEHVNGDNSLQPDSPLIANLSARERQILSYLGDGLTTQAMANNLGLASTTIETYRERIKIKLKLPNSAELNRFAILWRIDNP